MIYTNSTPIVKDSSELSAPYISVYNQVFIENEIAKLIIHHEIYPIYIGDSKKNIIPNESVLYFIKTIKLILLLVIIHFIKLYVNFIN